MLCLLACTSLVLAQDEEIVTIKNSYALFPQIITTLVWSFIYIAIYAAAVLIPLGYLRLFNGFENEMLTWVGVLWLGGMAINALAYMLVGDHHRIFAILIAMPLLFGWSVFVNTRNFADLVLEDAARVAIVVAILCTPWFGPTWRIHRPKATVEESRIILLTLPVHSPTTFYMPVEG